MTQNPRPLDQGSAQNIQLLDCLLALWRRKTVVAAAFAAFVGAGAFYASVAPRVHRATARLLVVRQDASGQQTPVRYDPAFVATQAEIVRSRMVVERALDTYTPSGVSIAEDPVATVSGAIRVTPLEGTYVMQVSYQCPDGRAAEQMLEAVITSYGEYLRDSEEDSHLKSLMFLTETEQQLREQLEQKEQEYRQLLKDGTLLAADDDAGRVQTAYLSNLGKALTEAKNRRLRMETASAEWMNSPDVVRSSVGRSNETVLTSLSDIPSADEPQASGSTVALQRGQPLDHVSEMRAVKRELHATQQREADLRSRYGEKHNDVRAIGSQIQRLETQIEELLAEIPEVFENELAVIRKHEQELEELYGREIERATQSDINQLENRHYLDTIERLRTAHGSILAEMHTRRLATASVTTGQGSVHVKTITAPRASGAPIWPIPMVVLSVCSVLGLAAGSGLAIGLDRFIPSRDRRPDASGDLQRPSVDSSSAANADDRQPNHIIA